MKLIYRNIYGEESKNVRDLISNNIDSIEKINNKIDFIDPAELSVKLTNIVSDVIDFIKIFFNIL